MKSTPRKGFGLERSSGFRAPLKPFLGFDLRTGVLALVVFSVVRVILVLQANVTGSYQGVSVVFIAMIALPWMIEWASRAPLGPGSKLEVRRIPSNEEAFADYADNEFIQKEKGWRADSL